MAAMTSAQDFDRRLVEHVERTADEHPPISLDSADFTMNDPAILNRHYGHVLDFMARIELEVDRNVLELMIMLPDAPEVDRHFYADVWQPQEHQHGLILDQLQMILGRPAADVNLDRIEMKIKILGVLSKSRGIHDVCRMLYYLTGMATERSAVLAYNLLHDGVVDLGEDAVAATIVRPIKRQEPAHYAFYKLSARGLWPQLSGWQQFLVQRMRRIQFAPVGVRDNATSAEFGRLMASLGIDDDLDGFAVAIGRVEAELFNASHEGLQVPDYILTSLRESRDRALSEPVPSS